MKKVIPFLAAVLIFFAGCSVFADSATMPPLSSEAPPISPSAEVSIDKPAAPEVTESEDIAPQAPAVKTPPRIPDPSSTVKPSTAPTPMPVTTLTFVAVGDNLVHDSVIRSGKQADGSYNYDHLFIQLKEEFQSADLAAINQETIYVNDPAHYTNYPSFGTPAYMGLALIDAGFDIVTHATNHTYDKGMTGLNDTLNFWAQHPEMTVLGIHDSPEDAAKIKVIEKNGISLALLNYTYSLNGLYLPADKSYMVDMLYDAEKISADIRRAEELADLTVVFMHAGTEYMYTPDSTQTYWAKLFCENGVDLVVGGHPHVIQPVDTLTSGDGHEMLIYYSLGNYVSHQNEAPRMLGLMANVTFEKIGDRAYVKDYSATPIVTHIESGYTFRVFKLEDYTQELSNVHAIRYRAGSSMNVDNLWALYDSIMG